MSSAPVEIELARCAEPHAGALYYGGEDAERVLRRWARWSRDLPDHTNSSLALQQLPSPPNVPPPLAGWLTVAVRFASTESPVAGEWLLAEAGPRSGSPQTITELRLLGGAYAWPAAHPSAFCHRDATYGSRWSAIPGAAGLDRVTGHGSEVLAAVRTWTTGGMLPNLGLGLTREPGPIVDDGREVAAH